MRPMKIRCSSSPRGRGIALVAAVAAAGSLAVVGAQQPPAQGGQKPAAPAGQPKTDFALGICQPVVQTRHVRHGHATLLTLAIARKT